MLAGETTTGGSAPAAAGPARKPEGWRGPDVLRAAALVFGLYFALQLIWLVHPVVLTGFIGLLFGLAVARGADLLERFKVPRGIAAALIVLATYAALVGVLAIAAPTLGKQFGELRAKLPQAMDRVDQWIAANKGNVWGQMFASPEPGGQQAAAPASALPAPTPASRDAGHGAAHAGRSAKGASKAGSPPPAPQGSAPEGAPPGPQAAGAATTGAPTGAPAPAGATPGAQQGGAGASAAAGGAAAPGTPRAAGAAASGKPPAGAGTPAPGAPPAGGAMSPAAAPSPLRTRLAQQLGAATRYLFPFLSSTVEVLAGLLLITFVAIYFGVDPDLYRRGLLHLVPHASRERASEVVAAIGVTLRRWLMTQLIAMVVIGTLVWVTLAVMGVEAALSLGIIAGVLEFIPTIGPLLSALPAIAMGFLVSPEKALAVAIAFTLVQMIEGHVLIPMLMKRGMNLPPLITILGQAIMAVVFGFLGLLVAVPLVAMILTAVKMLYVNDVMGDQVATGSHR